MEDTSKTYSNGEVTIIWKPQVCIHSTVCWKGTAGLKEVFNPAERPWIKPEAASTERIIQQIDKCPSGALTYKMNNKKSVESNQGTISVVENGPLLVSGSFSITHHDGRTEEKEKAAFCRCGHSTNKPFCDGSHISNNFKG